MVFAVGGQPTLCRSSMPSTMPRMLRGHTERRAIVKKHLHPGECKQQSKLSCVHIRETDDSSKKAWVNLIWAHYHEGVGVV